MNMKRMRGRNHRQGGGGSGGGGGGGGFRNQQNGIPLNRNHVFDSTGPEMRVRGTAQQLYDKYTQMARDASSSGDRVLGEAYYQHAEHYFRIISAINQAQGLPPPGQGGQQPQQNGEFQRREPQNGENPELQGNEQPRQERQERPERNENRNENRQERRFEQRPRQEFQRDRNNDRNEPRPYRPATPAVADAPIDISSALEAELAAASASPAGFGEQPVIHEVAAAPEPRAIPIISDAPPPPAAPAPVAVELPLGVEPAATEEAAPAPRRRGRPRTVKVDAVKAE